MFSFKWDFVQFHFELSSSRRNVFFYSSSMQDNHGTVCMCVGCAEECRKTPRRIIQNHIHAYITHWSRNSVHKIKMDKTSNFPMTCSSFLFLLLLPFILYTLAYLFHMAVSFCTFLSALAVIWVFISYFLFGGGCVHCFNICRQIDNVNIKLLIYGYQFIHVLLRRLCMHAVVKRFC